MGPVSGLSSKGQDNQRFYNKQREENQLAKFLCFGLSFCFGEGQDERLPCGHLGQRNEAGRNTGAAIALWPMVRQHGEPLQPLKIDSEAGSCLQPMEDPILEIGTASKEGYNSAESLCWS